MIVNVLDRLRKSLERIIIKLGYEITSDDIVLEEPRDKNHGDYATNVAMRLAKVAKVNPRQLALKIVELIDQFDLHLSNVEIAGAGFINFTFDENYLIQVVNDVIKLKDKYGNLEIGKGKRINLEFVSANPTGYLHIGHGRGAAYGDSLANVLIKAGYLVDREHYVNDAGNQITNLAYSIEARYREILGLEFEMKEEYYHGKEIILLANKLVDEYGDHLLMNNHHAFFRRFGCDAMLENLKKDLARFNVKFDTWFSEQSLYESDAVESVLKLLQSKNFVYEKDGAIWLKTIDFQDEKDRVIVKSDGTYTYLLPDIAYHADKLSRGYDHLIDVLGADHHGYISRLKAAVSMLGGNSNLIDIEILQMVRVIENGVEIKMSKRSGKAITLIDLIDQVGTDALRYFYISKSLSTHMDLDLDLMTKRSNENPVFYAQYAHARIESLFKNLSKNDLVFKNVSSFQSIDKNRVKNMALILLKYPLMIEEVANSRLVHKVTHYIDELAAALHSYYNDEKIITDDITETMEKLTVLKAVQIVLKNALTLIGISAPLKM